MLPRRKFVGLIMLTCASLAPPVWAQTVEDMPGLNEQERLQFQARMRNAHTDAERDQIRAEYRQRVQVRQQQQGGAGQGGSGGGGQGGGGGGQGGGS